MQWQRRSFCCNGVTESRWQWVFGGNGCSAVSTSTLAIFSWKPSPDTTPLCLRQPFCYIHDHETVNYSQHFVNLATGVHMKTVPNRTIQYHWSACKATLKRQYGVTCQHMPSYVDEYIWRKKATWRGMHVCGVFWVLSPSPSRNPEVDNKQTEVRLLMSIMWGEIVNKWTFLRNLHDSGWNRHWNVTKHVCYTICRHLVAVRT